MHKILLVLVSVFLNLTFAAAQEERLPYFSNGKYGIVDQKGNTIIPPIYDNVAVRNEYNVITLMKDDLWAVYDFNGKQILDHVIANKKGPYIFGMKNGFAERGYRNKPFTNFLSVRDPHAKVKYFINPNVPRDNYKAYNYNETRNKNPNSQFYYPITNNYIVANMDGSFMAIDSTGKELLDKSVEEAYVLSNDFTAVGKDKIYALYKNGIKTTDFIYTKFTHLNAEDVFHGTIKVPREGGGYPKSEFHLFDKEGNIIAKSERLIDARNNRIIVNTINEESFLYDSNLQELKSFGKRSIEFLWLGKSIYIKSLGKVLNQKRAYNVGISDIHGTTVLDTIYSSIYVRNGHISCVIEGVHAVLDSNLNTVIESDIAQLLEHTKREGLFKFTINDDRNRPLEGIMDINQNPIIPAKYKNVTVYPCIDFALLTKGDSSILKRLSDGKIIAQNIINSRNRIEVKCHKERIEITTDTLFTTLDFDGKILKLKSKKDRFRTFAAKFKAKRIGKMYALSDQEGNIVNENKYKKIEIITDPATGKSAYFCIYAEKKHPSCKVLNDELKVITPPGYSIPGDWFRHMKHNKGTLYIINDADVAINRHEYKSGIIDYDGNWIVEPFNGSFTLIDDGIFILSNRDIDTYEFYNAKGQKTNTRGYHVIGKMNGSDHFQNRIQVGVYQDKSYTKRIREAIKGLDTNYDVHLKEGKKKHKKNYEKLIAVGDPGVLYGYVNKQGKEIIPPKYISAEAFGMSEPYATVKELDEKGNISTHIIDTLDNKIFSVPYESFNKLYDGYYTCLSNGLYGIVDSTGSAKTPFKFTRISNNFKLSYLKVCSASDSTNNYIIDSNFNIIPLEKSKSVMLKRLNKKYFYAMLAFDTEKEYVSRYKCLIYSNDLELVGSIDNTNRLSEKFDNSPLPLDYFSFRDKDRNQIVYSIKEKKILMAE